LTKKRGGQPERRPTEAEKGRSGNREHRALRSVPYPLATVASSFLKKAFLLWSQV
jgi:hypothetical protein